MPMLAGSTSVDPLTGVATGTGLSKELYDLIEATVDYLISTTVQKAAARQNLADLSNSIASAVVTHITTNAEVITVGTATAVQPGAGTAPTTGTGTIT